EALPDPLGVEWIGADHKRGEHIVDQRDGTGLCLAAPDTGDARLAQPDVPGVVADADQDIVAADVFAEGANDGEVGMNVAGNRLGADGADWHGSSFALNQEIGYKILSVAVEGNVLGAGTDVNPNSLPTHRQARRRTGALAAGAAGARRADRHGLPCLRLVR